MPPLAADGVKTVFDHDVSQEDTVLMLFVGDALVVGVGDVAEEVERTAHVNILACGGVYDGEVNSGAAGVTGLGGDKPAGEDLVLGNVGVKEVFHGGVGRVLCPAHKVVDGRLWPVGIVNLQSVTFCTQLVGCLSQCRSGLAGQYGHGSLVTVDARTNKIVIAVVTYVECQIGNGVCEVAKPVWKLVAGIVQGVSVL